jgi:hypothetical protein
MSSNRVTVPICVNVTCSCHIAHLNVIWSDWYLSIASSRPVCRPRSDMLCAADVQTRKQCNMLGGNWATRGGQLSTLWAVGSDSLSD